MNPPAGSKTAQGYELQWGTNVVGHFVFAKQVLPAVKAAAKTGIHNATRIVWTSSNGHNFAPKGIINFDDVNLAESGNFVKYGQSKAVYFILINLFLTVRVIFYSLPIWLTISLMMEF